MMIFTLSAIPSEFRLFSYIILFISMIIIITIIIMITLPFTQYLLSLSDEENQSERYPFIYSLKTVV